MQPHIVCMCVDINIPVNSGQDFHTRRDNHINMRIIELIRVSYIFKASLLTLKLTFNCIYSFIMKSYPYLAPRNIYILRIL